MEPPQQSQGFDFSNADAFFDPNLHPNDVANIRQEEVTRRARLESISATARDVASSAWKVLVFGYGLLVYSLQMACQLYGVLVYMMNEGSIYLASGLRLVARQANAAASSLEANQLRPRRSRSRHTRRQAAQVVHTRSPARSTRHMPVQPVTAIESWSPVQAITQADLVTVDSQVSDSYVGDRNTDDGESIEETAYEVVRYQGQRDRGEAQAMMMTSKKVTRRQRGRQAIRALRQKRMKQGLKIA